MPIAAVRACSGGQRTQDAFWVGRLRGRPQPREIGAVWHRTPADLEEKFILPAHIAAENGLRLRAQVAEPAVAQQQAVAPDDVRAVEKYLGVRLQLGRIEKHIFENHKINFTYDKDVVAHIVSRCTEYESGGRMIDSILTNTVLPRISRKILTGMMEARPVHDAKISVAEGEFAYKFE